MGIIYPDILFLKPYIIVGQLMRFCSIFYLLRRSQMNFCSDDIEMQAAPINKQLTFTCRRERSNLLQNEFLLNIKNETKTNQYGFRRNQSEYSGPDDQFNSSNSILAQFSRIKKTYLSIYLSNESSCAADDDRRTTTMQLNNESRSVRTEGQTETGRLTQPKRDPKSHIAAMFFFRLLSLCLQFRVRLENGRSSPNWRRRNMLLRSRLSYVLCRRCSRRSRRLTTIAMAHPSLLPAAAVDDRCALPLAGPSEHIFTNNTHKNALHICGSDNSRAPYIFLCRRGRYRWREWLMPASIHIRHTTRYGMCLVRWLFDVRRPRQLTNDTIHQNRENNRVPAWIFQGFSRVLMDMRLLSR